MCCGLIGQRQTVLETYCTKAAGSRGLAVALDLAALAEALVYATSLRL
jgi:hypothetical protein